MTTLFLVAVSPGIAFALGIYLTDRYDREPVHLLLKVFIFGALMVIPAAAVELILTELNIFTGYFNAAYGAFIIAGMTEEYFKRWVVLKFAFNHKEFNERLDGIVYAAFSALGFATIENILYVVFRFGNDAFIGISRAALSVPGHMLFGITMGYYLSLAKYSDSHADKKKFMRKSLYMPIILHGTFNFILTSQNEWLLALFIPFVLYLWIINLHKLRKYWIHSKDDYYKKDEK